MAVLEPAGRPFSDVENVGLVIQRTQHGSLHSGLLYKLPGGQPRILHLAFHHDLRDEPASAAFRWAQLGLDEVNSLVLATLVSRIAGTRPLISYGFDAQGARFDQSTGDLVGRAEIGKGVTCATFIIAVLRTYEYLVIEIATWPDREDDRQWEAIIIDLLTRHATAEHVTAVRLDIGAKRVRPDEIVGAATLSSELWPVTFEDSRRIADGVIADLASPIEGP